jgi:pyruvate ferredoxin oxidoreductase delta subunit
MIDPKITPGLVAAPASSILNYTGGWRTEHPRFLQQVCTGCDLCVAYCPEGIVFRIDAKRYDFDRDYCKGCGICAEECPVHDIVMEAEVR